MAGHYTGIIIPIPVGHGGLTGERDQADIAPDKLLIARNLAYEGSTLTKEGGAALYNDTPLTGAPSVIAGWDWWPSDGVQRMVVLTDDGDLFKDDGSAAFGTTLTTGLTVTNAVPVFVDGGKEAAANDRKLFLFTGQNAVQVLAADGATTSNLATPPADWTGGKPTFGFIHEGRLFGGGNLNDPHRLYYSTTDDHEDFTGSGAGSIGVYSGVGERLVGGVSFKGVAIVWKYPTGIFLIDTSDPSPANWRVKPLSTGVGGVSPRGHVIVDNDIIFAGQNGNFHLLSAVQEFGDIASSNLTKTNDINWFIEDNFNLARAGFIRGVYYEAKREAHFAVAGIGSTVNNARFIIDMNRKDAFRFRYSDRDVCESLWLRKDSNAVQRPVSGDDAGSIWLMDRAVKSKDGEGYSGAFQTPHMDFAYADAKLATTRKQGMFLELVVTPTGNWNLEVDVIWDGTTVQTITFNMGVSGAALGSFVLDTDKLAGSQILNRKKHMIGSGRRLSLAGRNATAGEDFAVGHFFAHLLVLDERPGRDSAI